MDTIHLGIGGVAGLLVVVLWFGTKGGGKVGTLSWGWTLFLAMVAGCAFKAAGPPFSWVTDLINTGLGMIGEAAPGVTAAGVGVILIAISCFVKLTLRQVTLVGVAFFNVAAGAGGPFEWLAGRIEIIAMHWA
ncbi:hypothetical protein ABZ499_32965 [Streptomyces sp. NPDC019990]|uniref:hypothetical protein n=1 Tax=Streptomyces sp. NPDC019990 TaxID=3154693 RepID=UPI0033F78C85